MKKIIIIGSGGHANSVLDIINNLKNFKFVGFIDKNVNKARVIGTDKDLKKLFKKIKYAAIGVGQIQNPNLRKNLFKKLKKIGFKLPVIISPNAYVSKSSKIEEGTFIMHGAIINANAKVGYNCIINSKALVEHDVLIGNNCHISTNSVINGHSIVGDDTFIGSGAIIVNSIKIKKKKNLLKQEL